MAKVRLTQAAKAFGPVEVLKGIDLDIADGEFVVFVGPSGCGKSTLLRSIAGLETLSSGTVEIDGRAVNDVAPSERGIAMVFQSYALYPHMSVRENMGFALKLAGRSKAEIAAAVDAAAATLDIAHLLDRRPKELSGGQRQRVAIGRAIVRQPKVFLFDEPLSNLDAALRVRMRYEFAGLHKALGTTMIYVTHDQVEAMTLADRIVVLSAGNIEQVGAPLELYERPANLFVAKFIGSPAMNIIPATITDAGATTTVTLTGGKSVTLDIATAASEKGKQASFGVRPEDLRIADPSEDYLFEGEVSIVEQLGEVTLLYIEGLVQGEPIIVKLPGIFDVKRGQKMHFVADRQKLHLFDAAGHTYRK